MGRDEVSNDLSDKEKDEKKSAENSSVTGQVGHEPQSTNRFWQSLPIILSAIGLFLVVDHVFYFGLLGKLELQSSYSYPHAIFPAGAFLRSHQDAFSLQILNKLLRVRYCQEQEIRR